MAVLLHLLFLLLIPHVANLVEKKLMRRLAATLVLAALAIAGSANAQQPQQNFRVELNFSSPGARSLALGGAFLALADDATAAYANPAGLINLSRPEVSLEGRSWKYTHVYNNRGHAFGPLGITGAPLGVDDTKGILASEADDTTTGASFLSFVYPFKKWSLAFYRHELANFEANVETQGLFFNVPSGTGDFVFRFRPTQAHAELDIVNYGLSSAYRINDRFSAGLGLSFYDFQIAVQTRRFGLKSTGTGPGDFFGPADFSDSNLVSTLRQQGDDSEIGVNAGLLWKVTDNWSLGTVYRKGVSFGTEITIVPSPLPPDPEEFQVPDVFAFGTAFRPTQEITVSVDLNHIDYSSTFEETSNVRIDDTDEIHFGVEYLLLKMKVPVSFRAGAWYDPDHQPSYRGYPDETAEERAQSLRFPRGADDWHYSGGLGFVLGERVQIDTGFDVSDRIDTLSLSSVYRF